MSCKGKEGKNQNPIKYTRKPPKITLTERGEYCMCDNCAGYGPQKTYILHFSLTDYGLPSGNIGKNRYAKPRELWLCEDCLQELKEALDLIYVAKLNDKGKL